MYKVAILNIINKKHLLVVFLALFLMVVLLFEKLTLQSKDCSLLAEPSDQQRCWSYQIKDTVERDGVSAALNMVSDNSLKSQLFSNNCHDYIHIVGNSAYEKFVIDGKVDINEMTTICAYGFYHGFMEALVSKSGDVAIASDFCRKVREEYMNKLPMANLACFHGIGHGWAGTHDKSLWGDELAMVEPALQMCERVTSDPHELKICATGVFDSISIGYYNRLYGLEIKKDDPFWLCKKQPQKYKEPCYMDLVPAVVWLAGHELLSSLSFLDSVEYQYRDLVVETIADNMVRFNLNKDEEIFKNILICRGLSESYYKKCVLGTSKGSVQFGKPGIEYAQGLSLCNDSRMTVDERDICLSSVLLYASSSYDENKFWKICNTSNDYMSYCKAIRKK